MTQIEFFQAVQQPADLRVDIGDARIIGVGQITGLIVATTLVRPSKDITDVKLKSIRKKWKNHKFAAGVNRAEVETETADFSNTCFDGQLDLWTHISHVLTAMQGASSELGLDGRLAH